MPRPLLFVACLFAAFSLGCAFGDEQEQAPPPQPMALILPTWLMGRWEMARYVDDHLVVRVPCDGSVVTVEVEDGGRITVGQGEERDALLGRALAINEDGSLTITLDGGGRIEVETTTDPGVIRMKGGHRLLSEGVLLASTTDSIVEHRHAPVSECGAQALDLSAVRRIAEQRFNADGDPCMAAALRLSLSHGRPTLLRAGIEYRIVAAHPTDAGTWLTVLDPDGGAHGMRLDPLDDGGVRIWQRVDSELGSEVLLPVRGACRR